jgi:hypothetical protein
MLDYPVLCSRTIKKEYVFCLVNLHAYPLEGTSTVMASLVSFDEIVPNAQVRSAVIHSVQYLSIRDIIMYMCGKDANHSADWWRTLSESRKSELTQYLGMFKFPGRGNTEQPVITFPGAIKLAMFLPGENAKNNRTLMARILQRYYAGDESLITEIEANANSSSPVAEMARASLETEQTPVIDMPLRRKREELELAKLGVDVQAQEMQNVRTFKELMDMMDPDWERDTRLKLNTQDWIKNIAFNQQGGGQLSIGNGTGTGTKLITISEVAQKLGYRLKAGDLTRIGRNVAKAYQREHGETPPKCSRFVDGAVRDVNGYTDKDWDMIAREVRDHMDAGSEAGF